MAGDDIEMADLLAGAWCGYGGQPPEAPNLVTPTEQPLPYQQEVIITAPVRSPPLPGTEQVPGYGNSIAPSCTGTTVVSGSRHANEVDLQIMGIDATYLQCKAARTISLSQNTLDCNISVDIGTTKVLQHERVGSLAVNGDDQIEKTFRGSRISSGEKIVNQNIALSFDPLTLICTVCKKPHSILPTDGSGLAIFLSDQNFATCVVGKEHCVPVIRIEDATLVELAEFSQEVLGRTPLPAGTLFMVGTVSHLVNVGITIYALDWQRTVAKFTDRWPNCKVGPLPPVLREDSPGSTALLLTQLRHWFSNIYAQSDSIVFNKTAWDQVIRGISNMHYPGQDMDHTEFHTISLPINLKDRTLHPLKTSRSSTHAITSSFDGEVTNELLLALLHALCSLYGCKANPEDLVLARAPAECEGSKVTPNAPNTLIFIGASHMKRIVSNLEHTNWNIVDLTHPGWSLTEQNIAKVIEELSKVEHIGSAVAILDVVSNASFRFENREDGSLSLPFKVGGHYHMDGRVTTCTLETLNTMLNKARPIFDAIPGTKLCVPPLPRYLRTPCCDAEGHCEGITESDYAVDLMSKTLGLRRQIKEFMVQKGHSTVFVPDTIRLLCPTSTSTSEIVNTFMSFSHSDGVHLLDDGYATLGTALLKVLGERIATNAAVSGKSGEGRSFYWRGFTSPVGSARPKNTTSNYKDSHPGGGKWREPPNRFYSSRSAGRGRGKPYFHGAPGGRNWN
jgi:hypothetical protein